MEKGVLKVDLNPTLAAMSLPPQPVVLLAVGEKEQNVTTVGMFNVFSMQPVTLGVGIKVSRFSYKLLEETPDFSVNIPGKDLLLTVIKAGEKSGSTINKFVDLGLTPVPGKRIKSPVIKECLINIECRKKDVIEVGDHVWFLGEVVHTDIVENYDKSDALLYWDGEFRTAGDVITTL